MNWGRLDDPAWWWQYALDGVVGGVIGGLVTALAVLLTLRHERRLAEQNARSEVALSELTTARALGVALITAARRTINNVGDTDSNRAARAMAELSEAGDAVAVALMSSWPNAEAGISEQLRWLSHRFHAHGDRVEKSRKLRAGLRELDELWIQPWLRDPQVFETVTTPPADGLLRRLRAPHWARVRLRGKPIPAPTPTSGSPQPRDPKPKIEE